MSLALSIYVLLISLMQLVKGAQFLNITFLSSLFAAAPSAAMLLTLIVPVTRIYASLKWNCRYAGDYVNRFC